MKIALVVSKIDEQNAMNAAELGLLVGLPELQVELAGRLTVIHLSSTLPETLDTLRTWLRTCSVQRRER